MNRTERFYKIDQMLHERGIVQLADFLRVRLNAPIVWDRAAGGYLLARSVLAELLGPRRSSKTV